MKKLISAVVPCYNEEESLPLFYRRIRSVAETLPEADFEFVFVDDGSRDGTLRILRELAKEDARVRYLSFSRNFGRIRRSTSSTCSAFWERASTTA